MRKLLGLMILVACSSGCFFEHDGGRHHGREAIVERGHDHCEGCGHVQVRGIWYIRK